MMPWNFGTTECGTIEREGGPMTLQQLILEAIEQGYDVKITMRLRDDGKEGLLTVPIPWARRLGLDDAAITKLQMEK